MSGMPGVAVGFAGPVEAEEKQKQVEEEYENVNASHKTLSLRSSCEWVQPANAFAQSVKR